MVAAGDPIKSLDITTLEDYTYRKPLVRLIQSGTQSLADNTQTALTFSGTDSIDTHGFHDPATNNSRVTPSVAGYYTVRGTYFTAALVNGTTLDVNIRKNGSSNIPPANRKGGSIGLLVTTSGTPSTMGGSNAVSISCECLVDMNGSTDYVELVARQDSNAAASTNNSSQFVSVLELVFERII